MLHTMESQFGDVCGRSVADIGCGTGRLAIGCSILGARSVDHKFYILCIISFDQIDFRVLALTRSTLSTNHRACQISVH